MSTKTEETSQRWSSSPAPWEQHVEPMKLRAILIILQLIKICFSLTSCHENQQKHPSKNLPISICTSTCASKIPHFCLVGLLYFLGSMTRLNLPIFSKQRLETPHVLSIASHLSASSGDLQQQIWRPMGGPRKFGNLAVFEKQGTVWLPSFFDGFFPDKKPSSNVFSFFSERSPCMGRYLKPANDVTILSTCKP